MTALLDGNVLVALVVEDHVHHDAAVSWFEGTESFASCPITQATLLRILIRGGIGSREALAVLAEVAGHSRHEFWPDALPFAEVDVGGVVGHRQVTDAYLAQLARSRSGRLATFDGGLAALHPDVAEPIAVGRMS